MSYFKGVLLWFVINKEAMGKIILQQCFFNELLNHFFIHFLRNPCRLHLSDLLNDIIDLEAETLNLLVPLW